MGTDRQARAPQPTVETSGDASTSQPPAETSDRQASPSVAANGAGQSDGDSNVLPTTAPTGGEQTIPLGNGAQAARSVPDVVRSVRPAVVQIIVATPEGSGSGSGFIIDKESHIITNNHVVEGATRVTVVLPDNRTARAEVIGADPLTDLAVIQIPQRNLPIVPLGDSSKLEVGETVIAIGSALGRPGGPTVTTGVASALNRSQSEPGDDPSGADVVRLYDLIQTDAAINPGNSGGPLLNLRGEVVGINTLGQRLTESGVPVQGINYAVSVNTAKAVAQEIIADGQVVYPFIGVQAEYLYPQTALSTGLPDVRGQYIADVIPNTPASEAGLRRGDIITAIDGNRIGDESTFIRLLRSYDPGDNVTFTILRNNRTSEIEVTLAERPE